MRAPSAIESGMHYRPPRWLRNPHLQSILPSLPLWSAPVRRRARALLAGATARLYACGAGVRLQGFHSAARPGVPPQRVAVVLHGWEGHACSVYVLSLGACLLAAGYDVIRLNLRDHGDTQALNRELFHSCRLADVQGAVAAIQQDFPEARLYLAGFSLGGNFMLRLGAALGPGTLNLACIAAVSPVLEPEHTLQAMETSLGVYRRYFVRRWSRSLLAKGRTWPAELDFRAIIELQDLRAMTRALVARCTEFQSLDAYLSGYALTGSRLAGLAAPAGLLCAADDPLIPVADVARLAAGPRLRITLTEHGGHCGFIEGRGTPSFADRYVLAEFAAAR